MKKTVLTTALAVTLATGPVAHADPKFKNHPSDAFYDYAKVVNVEPISRLVTVSVPRQECWEEEVSYPSERVYQTDAAGNMILGGIIGGVIGNRFGDGDGQKAATLAGTLIGASIGHDNAQRRVTGDSGYRRGSEQRCRTQYQQTSEQRIDGYRVTYRYKGELFTDRLSYDPGERMRVRISVRPAQDD
ncbi:MAG: hypothetical protein A2V90_08810 [Gammaproteobacteria bacterium RBG_16_57_12]|nr:MAG: hypothetical protein A2V90_08810 [Gammaproteobacteria bacterium RBG_16_57_12]